MKRKTLAKEINSGVIALLETAQGRIKLLKAGLTGKEIENRYIQYSGLELVGVNWLEA